MLRWIAVKCKIRAQPPPKTLFFFGGGADFAIFLPKMIFLTNFKRKVLELLFCRSPKIFWGPVEYSTPLQKFINIQNLVFLANFERFLSITLGIKISWRFEVIWGWNKLFGCSILHEDVRFALYEHPRAFTSKPRACSYPTWPNIYIKIALFKQICMRHKGYQMLGRNHIFW